MPIALRRILFPRFVRRPVKRFRRGPFGRLIGHFLARVVAPSGAASEDYESSGFALGAGGLLGLLTTPGALGCFLLLDKYSSLLNWMRGRLHQDYLVTSMPDKFVFLSLAMAVTGIVTVLKWDRLLPDSQDYLNLAPLPVTPRRILFANVLAILLAVLIVALDVNAIPSLLFPAFVTAASHDAGGLLPFAWAHMVSVLLASLFTIATIFAILGTLAAVLPRDMFRACSWWVRTVLLLGLISLLPTGFAGATLMRTLERNPDSYVQLLPPVWFLGFYQTLQHRASPVLVEAGRKVPVALAIAFALMALSYFISYKRRFGAVLEGDKAPSEQRVLAVVLAMFDVFSSRSVNFVRACHRFVIRALLRSEAHRLTIAVAAGLGFLFAIQDVASAPAGLWLPPEEWLRAPLAVSYLLVLGMRLAFEMPAGVSSSWIFRATLDPRGNETLPVTRLVMASFLPPVVLFPTFVFAAWTSGIVTASVETAYVLAISMVLVEVQLAGYRKLPLTYPTPGFRDNLIMLCCFQFLGYEMFTHAGAAMERWMFRYPAGFLLVPAGIAAAWWGNRRRIADAREAGEWEEGMTFDNAPVLAVQRLNL